MKLQPAARKLFLVLIKLSLALSSFAMAQQLKKDPEFKIPLYFDVIGDGVKVSPLVLRWDLSDAKTLKIGNVQLNESTFDFSVLPAGLLDDSLKTILRTPSERSEYMLVLRWPKGLMQRGGNLETYSKSGRLIWAREIKKTDLIEWQDQLKTWKEKIRNQKGSKVDLQKFDEGPFWKSLVAVRNFRQEKQPFFNLEEPFRMCLTDDLDGGLRSRLCTRLLVSKKIKKAIKGEPPLSSFESADIRFVPVERSPEPPRVIAFNDLQQLKGEKPVKMGTAVQFYAETSSGLSYDFFAKPTPMNIVEIVKEPSGMAKVTAWGYKPNVEVKDLPRAQTFLEKWVGPAWYQTIGDLREFWEFQFDPTQPEVDTSGEGGGIFTLVFSIDKLPTEEDRPYLRSSSLDGTYSDGSKFYVKAPAKVKLSTQMNSVELDEPDQKIWKWRFGAKNQGEMNRSYLNVDNGENTFRAYREIYRGFPGDISARISGIVTSTNSLILLGEVDAVYWFETVLGSSNSLLSRDRWGVSASYFDSLTQLNFGSYTDTFTNTDFALKYRLAPGLWSRDESWGVQVGTSYLGYSIFQAQFFGAGVFWIRSLPKVLDDLLNLVPYFRKPKFMDFEFIYYPTIAGGTSTPLNFGTGLGNWHLDFKGKIMWSKHFYTDASAGIKQVDINNAVNLATLKNVELRLTSFFGTFGFGYSF